MLKSQWGQTLKAVRSEAYDTRMGSWLDWEKMDWMKFALSLERDCQEAVKWERRKLTWILEEEAERKRQAGETA